MDNLVSLRVVLVVGTLGILIDGTVVFATLVKEVEAHYSRAGLFARLATYKPVVGTLSLASHGDVLGRLGLKILGVVPVASHIADELEGRQPSATGCT